MEPNRTYAISWSPHALLKNRAWCIASKFRIQNCRGSNQMWLRKKKNLPRSFSRFVLGRRWISSNYYINIVIRNSSVMIFVNDWGGPNNVKELLFGHLLFSNGYLNIHDTFFWVWWINIYGENWSGRTDTKKNMKVWNLDPFWGIKKATKMQVINLTTVTP